MSTSEPPGDASPVPDGGGDADGPDADRSRVPSAEATTKRRRSPWIWVSAALTIVGLGLLGWALITRSDLHRARQDNAQLQAQAAQNQQTGSAVVDGFNSAYADVTQQLGAINEELSATEQDLKEAEAKAAESKATIAAALGHAGFTMLDVAALLATTASTNATLYASGSLTSMLAESGQFPRFFGAQSRLGGHAGLLITAALVLVVANVVDLSAIASVGSAIALAVFMLVALAGCRRRADPGANPVIALMAIGVSAVVLAFFVVDTLRNHPATFVAIPAIALLAIVLDALWRRRRPLAGVDPASALPAPAPR